MSTVFYEKHVHNDLEFPFYFHPHLKVNTSHLPDEMHRFHWHESIEILLTIKGNNTVLDNGEIIDTVVNDIAIINSGNLHAIYSTDDTSVHQCLIIDKSYTDKFGISILDTSFKNHFRDDFITSAFQQIAQELEEKQDFYKENIKAIIIQILTHIYRNYRSQNKPIKQIDVTHKHEMTKNIIDFLHKNFTSDLKIDYIAAQLGYNPNYICHVFRNSTGLTIGDYIRELRCNYASKLLAAGDYSIRDIAEMSGFHTPSYFSKIYKRHTGNLPQEEKKAREQKI
jgi:AraC-like DNA-binding protein